jgi:8-amino-3,8-dideoxy-alpha-D-manno-octulosonate transaminase
LLKNNINTAKIKFRKITDVEGDLADTLIFNFEKTDMADKFVKEFYAAGYGTKNVPDAIDWHFAGTWNQMFVDVPAYKNSWNSAWEKSAELLYRSVAIPVMVKSSESDISKQLETINKILADI